MNKFGYQKSAAIEIYLWRFFNLDGTVNKLNIYGSIDKMNEFMLELATPRLPIVPERYKDRLTLFIKGSKLMLA